MYYLLCIRVIWYYIIIVLFFSKTYRRQTTCKSRARATFCVTPLYDIINKQIKATTNNHSPISFFVSKWLDISPVHLVSVYDPEVLKIVLAFESIEADWTTTITTRWEKNSPTFKSQSQTAYLPWVKVIFFSGDRHWTKPVLLTSGPQEDGNS